MDRLKYWWYGSVELWEDLASILIPVAFMIGVALCSNSCGAVKEIPVQTIERVEYRDSLIYVQDTVEIPVPVEKVVEVLPKLDTSYLKTSLAESVAYLDTTKKQIHHTLEQKGSVRYVIDTVFVTEVVDRIVEKEVPVMQEVEVPVRDALFWVLVGWTLLTLLVMVLRLTIQPQTLVR